MMSWDRSAPALKENPYIHQDLAAFGRHFYLPRDVVRHFYNVPFSAVFREAKGPCGKSAGKRKA